MIRFTLLAFILATSSVWAKDPIVEVKTNLGSFAIELYPDKAPKTVENFLQYAKSSFYDGTIFHRVIDGFMVQGGGFDSAMRQKETRAPIPNEAEIALKKGLRNEMGTVAMARTPNPHSATAQFFINVKDNSFLDFRDPTPQGYGYAVFGRVVEGMNVVLRISKVQTATRGAFQNVPASAVTIESIKLKSARD
jgi:cyclophilin family peptidyl-prolyl cis-trans isomerase